MDHPVRQVLQSENLAAGPDVPLFEPVRLENAVLRGGQHEATNVELAAVVKKRVRDVELAVI